MLQIKSKNVVSDYDLSSFASLMPFLNFFHARIVSPTGYCPIGSIFSLSGINAVQKFAFVVKSFTKPPIRLSFTSNNKLVTSRITRCFTTQTNSAFDSILVLFDCSLSGYCRVFNFFITYKFLLTQQIFKNNTNVIILHFIKIF